MKLAKDWIAEADATPSTAETVSDEWRIRYTEQIQLDAFKAGMSEAARILDNAVDTHNSIGMAHREILTTRDAKTL